MKLVAIIVGAVFVLGALVAGCIAVVNDEDSLGPIQLVSHERDRCYDDCGDDWGGGSDGNSGGDYEGGRSGDQGNGDGQCRNFCNITVPMPGDGQRPEALIPPTPAGVRDFVLAVTKSGIEMGRLFADTTITFVSDLLIGLA